MAKQQKKQQVVKPLTAAERLGLRVSEMINSPKAQDLRMVTIHRLDTDSAEAWEGVMGVLAETDGLELIFNDDGTVTLKWEKQEREEEAW